MAVLVNDSGCVSKRVQKIMVGLEKQCKYIVCFKKHSEKDNGCFSKTVKKIMALLVKQCKNGCFS